MVGARALHRLFFAAVAWALSQASTGRAMPFGNPTGMTEGERAILGTWIDAGAKPE